MDSSDLLKDFEASLTPLKITLIVLSGVFGGIGLSTDFRNHRTGKVTPWGLTSLIGIILSTSLGAVTQWLDSSETDKQTKTTLLQLQRGLSSLDGMELHLRFRVPCENPAFLPFCSEVRKTGVAPFNRNDSPNLWKLLPEGGRLPLSYSIHFFAKPSDAEAYIAGPKGTEGDLRVRAVVDDTQQQRYLSLYGEEENQVILHTRFAPVGFDSLYSKGRILGKPDLSEAAMVIDSMKTSDGKDVLLEPHSIGVILKDGEQIYTPDNDFQHYTNAAGSDLYCGLMPKQKDAEGQKPSPFQCPRN